MRERESEGVSEKPPEDCYLEFFSTYAYTRTYASTHTPAHTSIEGKRGRHPSLWLSICHGDTVVVVVVVVGQCKAVAMSLYMLLSKTFLAKLKADQNGRFSFTVLVRCSYLHRLVVPQDFSFFLG